MRLTFLFTLTLVIACASGPPVVTVRRSGGLDGAWAVGENAETRLDVSGDVARLHFAGKEFEFLGIKDLKGALSPVQVELMADRFHVFATLETLSIRAGGSVTEVSMDKLPPRVQYADGVLSAE